MYLILMTGATFEAGRITSEANVRLWQILLIMSFSRVDRKISASQARFAKFGLAGGHTANVSLCDALKSADEEFGCYSGGNRHRPKIRSTNQRRAIRKDRTTAENLHPKRVLKPPHPRWV